jgi:hypothetical protein
VIVLTFPLLLKIWAGSEEMITVAEFEVFDVVEVLKRVVERLVYALS